MTTINLDLLDALRKLGIDEETARRAAQADKEHLATKVDLAEIRGEITLIKWMVGFNLALSFGILGKLLT